MPVSDDEHFGVNGGVKMYRRGGVAHCLEGVAAGGEVLRAGCPVSGSRTWTWRIAAPARAASIPASAICAGVTGTLSDRPVVSPAPVNAQVMKASRLGVSAMVGFSLIGL